MKAISKLVKKALNEESLILFDPDIDMKKSKKVKSGIKEFYVGDYVLYDPKIGYNNYIGDRVAICVNDEPGKLLYVKTNHILLNMDCSWANNLSDLYNDTIPEFANGYEASKYIVSNYQMDLDGTIWDNIDIDDGEYIPSINELSAIYDICSNNNLLWDAIGLKREFYWSSTLTSGLRSYKYADNIFFADGKKGFELKNMHQYAIVLLHID